ncbi:MAG: hypothetical protein ACI9AT_000430 [Ulvibacter sp.]|jgi:hypothetical protein
MKNTYTLEVIGGQYQRDDIIVQADFHECNHGSYRFYKKWTDSTRNILICSYPIDRTIIKEIKKSK